MGTGLALVSAVLYGISDFIGGVLSRRIHFATVALIGQVGGLGFMAGASLLASATAVDLTDLAWGGLSGVGTGVGMTFLFRGLSNGRMSVVVPVTAVGGAALPVLIRVALLGDRPSSIAWLGIAVAIPALWTVTRTGRFEAARPDGVGDALIASVGIAVQYLALAQADADSGIWPVASGRLAAVITIIPLVAFAGAWSWPRRRPALHAVATGVLAALALVAYLLATRQDLVAIAVVLSSLYPVIPVVLGVTVLRERLTARQTVGLVAAAAAVGLLATG